MIFFFIWSGKIILRMKWSSKERVSYNLFCQVSFVYSYSVVSRPLLAKTLLYFAEICFPDNVAVMQFPPSVSGLASKHVKFPLGFSHANFYVKRRLAVIGDACHRWEASGENLSENCWKIVDIEVITMLWLVNTVIVRQQKHFKFFWIRQIKHEHCKGAWGIWRSVHRFFYEQFPIFQNSPACWTRREPGTSWCGLPCRAFKWSCIWRARYW